MTPNTYRRQLKDAIVSALRARSDVAGCWLSEELARRLETTTP